MKRRSLLKSAAAAGVLGVPAILRGMLVRDDSYLDTIGLQLWTVRNQMESDPSRTLKAVAEAGYRQVELMNVLASRDIVAQARELGMQVTSAFVDWQSIGNPEADGAPRFDDILELAQALKLKHLVFGYIGRGHRESVQQFQKHAERANAAGEKCRKAGIQLCYHNHSFEFQPLQNERAGFDVLVDEFEPALVKFELDVFWAQLGGRNPLDIIRQLSGRISQLHLKDLLAGTAINYDEGAVPNDAFQELGDGVIDMAEVLNAGRKAGVSQCHVEQDQSPAPLESIVQSLQHLKSLN